MSGVPPLVAVPAVAWALADAPLGVVFVLVGLAIVVTVLGFVLYARARTPGRHAQRHHD